jgi:hypothetical protein
MFKGRAGKKISLSRETLRQLSADRLEGVAGGLPTASCINTCVHTCLTCGAGVTCITCAHTCSCTC